MAQPQPPTKSEGPYLIVGLGNPGPKYAASRHNAGFMVVDEVARRNGLRFSTRQGEAEIAKGEIGGVRVVLAKPQTFMNNSGRAVRSLSNFYKIPPERVFVAYDEIALPVGTIRIREKGSDAGHNGVKSVTQMLNTQRFPRLRVGVDRPVQAGYSQIDWVLGRFTKDEQAVMDEVISRSAEAVETVLREGVERAMNLYNGAEIEPARKGSTKIAERPRAEKKEPIAEIPPPERPHKIESWVERARRIITGEGNEG